MNFSDSEDEEKTTVIEQWQIRKNKNKRWYPNNRERIALPFREVGRIRVIQEKQEQQIEFKYGNVHRFEKVPSISNSPIKEAPKIPDYQPVVIGRKPKKTDREKEEEMHDVHVAKGMFSCFCPICFQHSKPGINHRTIHKMPERLERNLQILDRENYYKQKYGGDKMNFECLLKLLLGHKENIAGCELLVTDTIIFDDGVPKLWIYTSEKDGFVQLKNQGKKVTRDDISKKLLELADLVLDRKRDNIGVFKRKFGPNFMVETVHTQVQDQGMTSPLAQRKAKDKQKNLITNDVLKLIKNDIGP